MKTPFLGPAYQTRSRRLSAQRLVNLYPEAAESTGTKTQGVLMPCPGLLLKATVGSGPIRGGINPLDGYAYVVSRSTVYRIDSTFQATSLGTLSSTEGPVSMDYNPTQLMIVDGVSGYIVTLSSGAFAEIADAQFPDGAKTVRMIDGYFVVDVPDSGQFQWSAINDGTSWDALDVTTVEGSPDKMVAVENDHRQLLALGERSTEVYENTGGTNTFDRVQFITAGCAAPYSVAKIDNTVMWLGRDNAGEGMVWRLDGYIPRRISTHAIEHAIKQYSDVEDAIGFSYQDEGHSFYVLVFPTGNATWVYDVAASRDFGYDVWHERAYRSTVTGQFGRYLANCYFFFFGQHIVGDYRNGRLYALSLSTFTDNADPRRWLRSWHAVDAQNYDPTKLLSVASLTVTGNTGVGLATGQGSDPIALLRVSDDGGYTWSSEIEASVGAMGAYDARIYFEQLGQGPDVVFELSGSDPVGWAFTGAFMDASYGR